MPAPLKIDLSEEEDKNLLELQKLAGIPYRVKSPVSYTDDRLGEQKVLEQTKRRGKRLNILGLYSVGVSFDYGLKLGSFNGDT